MRDVTKSGTVVMLGLCACTVSLVLAQSTATGPSVKPAAVAKKAGSAAQRGSNYVE